MWFVRGKLNEPLEVLFRKVQELKSTGVVVDDEKIIATLLIAMPKVYQALTTSIDISFSHKPAEVTVEFVRKLLQEKASQTRKKVLGRSSLEHDAVLF
ncbi:hypothetical protein JTB14_001001 [Gonioctena quinquepunctata]|nr:hypothetical protein JTB14_001001 [Gonioctena quinquepunctata]